MSVAGVLLWRLVRGMLDRGMNDTIETIYVALTGTRPEAWIPVQAIRRGDGTHEIISRNDDPEDEQWQFPCGSIVHCQAREFAHGLCMVAVYAAAPRSLRLVWPEK